MAQKRDDLIAHFALGSPNRGFTSPDPPCKGPQHARIKVHIIVVNNSISSSSSSSIYVYTYIHIYIYIHVYVYIDIDIYIYIYSPKTRGHGEPEQCNPSGRLRAHLPGLPGVGGRAQSRLLLVLLLSILLSLGYYQYA